MNRAKRKTKRGRCVVRFCRNPEPRVGKVCSKCKMRDWRSKYPIKAAFAHLKDSAKRRWIAFELTLEEFTNFCTETGYHLFSGNRKGSLTVDRIDPSQGYHINNIQVLELSENVAKGNTERCQTVEEPF